MILKKAGINTIFTYVNHIISAIMGYLYWILVANYLIPDHIGINSNFVNAAVFIGLFSRFGLDYVILSHLSIYDDNTEKYHSINKIFYTLILISIFGYSVFLIAFNNLLELNDFSSWLFFILGTGSWAIISLHDYYFLKYRLSYLMCIRTILISMIRIICIIILKPNSFVTFNQIWAITAIIGAFFGIILLYIKINLPISFKRSNKDTIKQLLKISSTNFIPYFIKMLPIYIFPIFITIRYGNAKMGTYYLIWTVTAIGSSLITSFSHLFLSELRNESNNLKKVINFFIGISVIMIVSLALFFIITEKFILNLFNLEENQQAHWLFISVVISKIPMTFFYLFEAYYRYKKRMKSIIIVSLCMSFATITSFIGFSNQLNDLWIIGVSWILGYSFAVILFLIIQFFGNFKKRRRKEIKTE